MAMYKLLQALGENPEGSTVELEEEVGQALCDLGWAEVAEEDDAEEEAAPEEEALVMNSAKKLQKQVTKAAAEGVAAALKHATKPAPKQETVPAEVKQGPIFKSNGHYIRAIIDADIFGDKTAKNKVMAHQEAIATKYEALGYQRKAILGIGELTQASGGYLVNPEFSPDVYTIPHTQLDLQTLCDVQEAKSNIFNQRFVNETSLVNGSIFGGLNMVSAAEGAVLTSSLPAWSNVAFTLSKFGMFVYYTQEVLEDSAYPLERELNEYATKAFVYGLNTQIVQGGTLEGLLAAPSLVTVTSSANDTAFSTTPATALTYADIANIWSRVYPDSQSSPGGVWLFHPSLIAPLTQMTYTFSGSNPAWSLNYDAREGLGTPYKLMGKPAYPLWACSAPGVAGDIMYVDFSTVKCYRKPFRVEVSKDFAFNTDQIAIKFIARLDCKTRFRNKVTGTSGAQQFSAVVTRSGSGT